MALIENFSILLTNNNFSQTVLLFPCSALKKNESTEMFSQYKMFISERLQSCNMGTSALLQSRLSRKKPLAAVPCYFLSLMRSLMHDCCFPLCTGISVIRSPAPIQHHSSISKSKHSHFWFPTEFCKIEPVGLLFLPWMREKHIVLLKFFHVKNDLTVLILWIASALFL